MDNIEIEDQQIKKSHAIFNAFLLLFISLLGFIAVGPYLGLLIALPFYPGELPNIQSAILNPLAYPGAKLLIYFMQAGATVGMFLLPALYVFVKKKTPLTTYFPTNHSALGLLIAGVVTFTFMGVNAIIIEWNAGIELPAFLSGFENWAKQTEDMASKLTVYLTTFTSPVQLLGALVVMAILPAIAEEFVFRGLLQKKLHEGTKNAHIAIWVSAFLFSAIHMQFFGFFPRMLLGALFGYMYLWSGNLLVPIFTHFVNNGLTLILLYLYNADLVEYNIQDTESPTLSSVLIFTIITLGLLFYFRKHYQNISASNGGLAEGV